MARTAESLDISLVRGPERAQRVWASRHWPRAVCSLWPHEHEYISYSPLLRHVHKKRRLVCGADTPGPPRETRDERQTERTVHRAWSEASPQPDRVQRDGVDAGARVPPRAPARRARRVSGSQHIRL